MSSYADIPALIAFCQSLPLQTLEPRRSVHVLGWQQDWDNQLAMLQSLVDDGMDALDAQALEAAALQDAGLQWENAAQTASTLLLLALDRGVPAESLRQLYVQTVAVWHDYASLLQQARAAGCAHTPQAIRPQTQEYQFALQLLAMAVLLDEQGEIPAVVEHLLHLQSDRLLDYLSAAATGLQQANENCFHPQPFEGLNEFFEQYGDIAAEPLAVYLEQHYSRFFALSLQAQKAHPRLVGAQAWGWWALEVGALVVLYDLDDSALRDSPHYPADLVDYALGVRD